MSEEKPRVGAWHLVISRMTAFKSDLSSANTDWWEELIPEPPENRNSRPKEGIFHDVGSFENGRLQLDVDTSRIDWHYIIHLKMEEYDTQDMRHFARSDAQFYELMKRWIKISPSVDRLAFGAILLQFVSSREEGYARISKFLPDVRIDPKNSSDFLYQINRPRKSSNIESLSINRLTKWSVAQLFTSPPDLNGQPPRVSNDMFGCRLELDINTSPNFQNTFPKEKILPLYDELRSMGEEIARDGDIK